MTNAFEALEDLRWITDQITEKLDDHELAGRILDNVVKLEAALADRCDVAKHECRHTSVPALQGNVCLFHLEWLGTDEPRREDYRFGTFPEQTYEAVK